MIKRYFYEVEYTQNGLTHYISNPYRYDNVDEAYEFLGKCIHDIVLANPGIVLTKANVKYDYENKLS